MLVNDATLVDYPNTRKMWFGEPNAMLNIGVIEDSHRNWSSLVILEPKSDISVFTVRRPTGFVNLMYTQYPIIMK